MGQSKTILLEKLREALSSVLPIVLIVLVLCFSVAPIPTATLMTFLIGAVLLLFVNHKSNDQPYMAVIGLSAQAEDTVLETLAKGTKKQVVKTKSISPEGIELTVEVRLQENSTAFMNSLAAIPGVSRATLVSYNGDYMG